MSIVTLRYGVINVGLAMGHHCINLLLAELVDVHYAGVYGSVYAIAEIAYNVTLGLGLLNFSRLSIDIEQYSSNRPAYSF